MGIEVMLIIRPVKERVNRINNSREKSQLKAFFIWNEKKIVLRVFDALWKLLMCSFPMLITVLLAGTARAYS